jgi:DNA-binding NarL/FixJ family response regulator
VSDGTITVLLADDNVIVREGVRALLARAKDVTVIAAADDLPSLVAQALEHTPDVVVSDIRMPPAFQSEGIDGCKEIRKRLPGTGIVILSQFDDPDYAIALLDEGAAGYAYLLKDRVAEGDQLVDAIRAVATGGSMLDPSIVDAMVRPAMRSGGLDPDEERLWPRAARSRRSRSSDARPRLRSQRTSSNSSVGSPTARRLGRRARCDDCACCTTRSCDAKRWARRCHGFCRAVSPSNSSRVDARSARWSSSTSRWS